MRRALLTALVLLFSVAPRTVLGSPTPMPGGTAAPGRPSDPYAGTLIQDGGEMLKFRENPGARRQTETLIDQSNRIDATGSRDQITLGRNLLVGQERAAEMVRMLKDEQLRMAFEKVTIRGKEILEENQSLHSPAAVIAGAASLWIGATIRLFRSDSVKIDSRIEARTQRGEFSLESPFLNSRILFQPHEGVNLNLNRSIASIHSTAELNYLSRTNSVSTQLVHPITKNLNFSIGSSQIPELNNQTDGRARIQYQINF